MAAVASTNNLSDDEAFADILDGVEEKIEQVSGDGAYDTASCYDEIAARGAKATIPPRFRCGDVVRRPRNWGGAFTQSSFGTD
ncbi:transposase [Chroococcidiopsis sp. FACHB-1243]|nr:transposase [Chroococcidiopsis sp. [FACHB-1243]]